MSWTIPSNEEADEFSKAYLAAEESYMEQYYANEMIKPTMCPCGELFDAKDSSFCPRCGCAYGELSGRYTNIGR